MRNLILFVAIASVLAMTTGCANGPIRKWFRGSACNTCQPAPGQPFGLGVNSAAGCNSGVCGSGLPASVSGAELNNAPVQSYYGASDGGVYQPNEAYGNNSSENLIFKTPNPGSTN